MAKSFDRTDSEKDGRAGEVLNHAARPRFAFAQANKYCVYCFLILSV